MWRVTVGVLACATLLLGALALGTVVAATRGARELERTLDHVKKDLAAEVPRPALAELAQVADGIENLARSLEASRKEQRELALELERKERHAALGRVVAGVAHEIRNPLAAMKLRVDLAKTSTSAPATFRGDLEELSLEIARLDRLVTDFLLVSGRRPARSLEISLEKLVRTRTGQLLPWALERDVGIVVAVEDDAWVACDPDACARAVDNLVRNAVEASCASPEARPPHVTVTVGRTDRDQACVRVEDEGEGVPEEKLAELFLPFFTTKPDGTGLGLAVSRAVAQANGGDVRYARVRGKTRFELSLGPSIPPPSPRDEARPTPTERAEGGVA
jgi:signal transduction histidine kinase